MLYYKIWFSLSSFGYKKKNELLNYYGNVNNLWINYNNGRIKKEFGNVVNEKLKTACDKEKIERIIDFINKEKIGICAIDDKKYPEKLKAYDDSPYMLYYRGNIEKLNNKTVAIVGSRKSDFYGENVAREIVSSLAINDINVVSGMAIGIDTYAHVYTLKNNGFTAAILGSGIDVIYPKSNINLYRNLADKGCVISEFSPHTKPFHYNFPIRNRIISGLSDLVIVIEASTKSGSLITAGSALDQGKDVMAVPGDVSKKNNEGTNKLIKDGAYVYTNIDDIYDVLKIKKKNNQKSKIFILNNNEKIVFNKIKGEPLHIDWIIDSCSLEIGNIYEALFNLEAKSLIKHLAGDFYIRFKNI
ncbi:DNA-processing protein DprA [Clostridium sp. DL1XJH146]